MTYLLNFSSISTVDTSVYTTIFFEVCEGRPNSYIVCNTFGSLAVIRSSPRKLLGIPHRCLALAFYPDVPFMSGRTSTVGSKKKLHIWWLFCLWNSGTYCLEKARKMILLLLGSGIGISASVYVYRVSLCLNTFSGDQASAVKCRRATYALQIRKTG